MPLTQGKSKAAFSNNVREMENAGHPLKVSLAAAYSEKRKAEHRRKMWRGGEAGPLEMSEEDVEQEYSAAGGQLNDDDEDEHFDEGGEVPPIPFSQALRRARRR